MINTICLYTKDQEYNKKFCNIANKIIESKKIFLHFSDINALLDFIKDKKKLVIIIDEKELKTIEDISYENKNYKTYILTENKNNNEKDNYIYKFQNIKNIIEYINNIEKNIDDDAITNNKKIFLYINVENNKFNENNIKKIIKNLSKKIKVLYINLNDFENYKNNIGFSNIIYNYKENKLNIDNITNQIEDKTNNIINTDILHSVTYPEDYNVITNIDLYKIIESIIKLNYNLFFINIEFNYYKLQYLLNISTKIIYFNSENINFNNFKNHIKMENSNIYNRLFSIDLNDKNKIDMKLINSLIEDK